MKKLLVVLIVLFMSISAYAGDKSKVTSESRTDTLYMNAPVETGDACLVTYVSMNFYTSSYSDNNGFMQEDQLVYVTVNTWDDCNKAQILEEGSMVLAEDDIVIGDNSVTVNNVTVEITNAFDSSSITNTVSFDGKVEADPDSWHAWSDSKEGSVDPSTDYKYTSRSSSNTYNSVVDGELRFNNTLLYDIHSTIYQNERESSSTFDSELSYPPAKG